MTEMKRYALYYAPRPGAFADHAASWLGWDPVTGSAVDQPQLPGLPAPLADLTADPRRYGFHGTIRAPFRPATGTNHDDILDAVARLAGRLSSVTCAGLRPETLGGFVALTPDGCTASLQDLAAAVVEGTNPLRAPLDDGEIARRRPERLSPRQRALLDLWGYPFVMEEFRFHLTLTDVVPPSCTEAVLQVARNHFAPVLPRPFVIEDLCLFGEGGTGRFHLLSRHALTG